MDETRPVPQVDIERDIEALLARLEEVTQKLARRAVEAAKAEHAYKVGYSKALLVAKADGVGAVALCEATALVECDMLLLERRVAEAKLQAASEAGRNARSAVEALRSLNTNHRALVTGQ